MGHLIYGATTALIFLLLEDRYTRGLLLNPRTAVHELRRGEPAEELGFIADQVVSAITDLAPLLRA
jgi:hypothetical protein